MIFWFPNLSVWFLEWGPCVIRPFHFQLKSKMTFCFSILYLSICVLFIWKQKLKTEIEMFIPLEFTDPKCYFCFLNAWKRWNIYGYAFIDFAREERKENQKLTSIFNLGWKSNGRITHGPLGLLIFVKSTLNRKSNRLWYHSVELRYTASSKINSKLLTYTKYDFSMIVKNDEIFMDTRLLISRERKERKIKNWHQFLIWVENRMDESHTDHLDFSFLLSQHWTENQTGYGIIQLNYVILPVQK